MKRGNLAEKSARCPPKTGAAGPSGLTHTRENEKIPNPPPCFKPARPADQRSRMVKSDGLLAGGKSAEYESAMVSMPYLQAEGVRQLDAAAHFAGRIGWTCSLHTEWSWYAPGATALVLFKPATAHEARLQAWEGSFKHRQHSRLPVSAPGLERLRGLPRTVLEGVRIAPVLRTERGYGSRLAPRSCPPHYPDFAGRRGWSRAATARSASSIARAPGDNSWSRRVMMPASPRRRSSLIGNCFRTPHSQ